MHAFLGQILFFNFKISSSQSELSASLNNKISFSADGVTYSFGLFIEEFVDFYGTGQGETAWIASILVGVTLCSGNWQKHSVNVSLAHKLFDTFNIF